VKVRGHLHAPSSLRPSKELPMPIEDEAGLAPESVLIHLKIEASIVAATPTTTRPTRCMITELTAVPRIRLLSEGL